MRHRPETIRARARVRALMPVEGDLAFRRRCETILEWLDPAPGETVLDCGCGYGFTLRVLADLTEAQLVGLDDDPDRVTHVQRDLERFAQVSVVQGDAHTLPFAHGAFHHAVCSEVLEHVPDASAVIGELARVVRAGGRLVITVPSAAFPVTWDPPNWILKRLGGVQIRGERPWSGIWYGHRRLYDWNALEALLAGTGLEVQERRPLTFRSPPFAHLLLYGIGKPLLQQGWLPRALRRQAGRVSPDAGPPGMLARLAMRALEAIDAPNDDPSRVARASEFVALAIVARRITQPGMTVADSRPDLPTAVVPPG